MKPGAGLEARRRVAGAGRAGSLVIVAAVMIGCGARSGLSSFGDAGGGAPTGATANTAAGNDVAGGGLRGIDSPDPSKDQELPRWQLLAAAGPSARWGHGIAYDESRQRVTIYGGWSDTSETNGHWPLNDTWEWDGKSWSRIADARVDGAFEDGAAPLAWIEFGMTYDSRRQRVVTHGGYTNGNSDNCGAVEPLLSASRATWQWDGVRWQPVTCDGPEAINIELVYDSERDRVVMVGGTVDPPPSRVASKYGTWELNGNNWLRVGDAPSLNAETPSQAVPGYAMAFDQRRAVTVLQVNAQTWEYAGGNWELKSKGGPPEEPFGMMGVRYGSEMVYDAQRQRIVLLVYDETWEWDGERWEKRAVAPSPSRASTHLSYDASQRYVVLFGGDNGDYGYGPLGGTWVYR